MENQANLKLEKSEYASLISIAYHDRKRLRKEIKKIKNVKKYDETLSKIDSLSKLLEKISVIHDGMES
jgi:predicted ATP-dependent Lon-type protease